MRNLRLAGAISAGVHAVAVALLLVRSSATRRPEPPAPPALIEVVTVDPAPGPPRDVDPLDVQLIAPPEEPPAAEPPRPAAPPRDRHSEPTPPRAAPATPPAARIDAAHVTGETTAPTAAPPADAVAAPPRQPGILAMRRGEVPRVALPAGRWDDLDHAPRGTSPEARPRSSGELHEAGGGTYTSDQKVFDATVRRDGTVELHDARNLNVHLALPTPKSLGRALAGWYESDKGASGKEGDTAMGKQIQVSAGATVQAPDPTGSQPEDQTTTVIIPVLAGGFDITDWLMRNHKLDPYDRRKLTFLDATRDERVAIGKRGRAEQLAMTPQIVLRSLEAMWAATDDLAARKRALFELWDDCVETGEPAVVEAAAAARRMIIGFLRARLPAGSRGAYTAAEIAALARTQHSHAVFQPYE